MRDDQQRRTLVTKRSSHLEDFIRKMKEKHCYPLRPSEIRLKDCANTQGACLLALVSTTNLTNNSADQRETSRRLRSPTSSLIPRSRHSSALHDWLYSAFKNLSKSWYRKRYACFYFYFYQQQQQFHCPSKINLALLFPWIPTFPINNLYTIVVWLQYLTGRYSWVCHLLPAENKLHTVHVSLTQGFSY